jgi:hypothetical protein
MSHLRPVRLHLPAQFILHRASPEQIAQTADPFADDHFAFLGID